MSTDVVIVEFEKEGGIQGLQLKMIISNNGHGILTGAPDAKEDGFDLNESQLDELRQALEGAEISKFNGQKFPCEGADMYEFSVTQFGDTVTMCHNRVPDQLRVLVEMLDRIAKENGGV